MCGRPASLANLIKKTRIDQKKLPKWIQRVLKFAKLAGQIEGRLDGPTGVSRHSLHEAKVDPATGELHYLGQFQIAPKSLLDLEILEDVHGSITLEFEIQMRLSLLMHHTSLDLVLGGEFAESRFVVEVGGEKLIDFKPFDGWMLDEISVSIPLPAPTT